MIIIKLSKSYPLTQTDRDNNLSNLWVNRFSFHFSPIFMFYYCLLQLVLVIVAFLSNSSCFDCEEESNDSNTHMRMSVCVSQLFLYMRCAHRYTCNNENDCSINSAFWFLVNVVELLPFGFVLFNYFVSFFNLSLNKRMFVVDIFKFNQFVNRSSSHFRDGQNSRLLKYFFIFFSEMNRTFNSVFFLTLFTVCTFLSFLLLPQHIVFDVTQTGTHTAFKRD